jgi:hypothetical protein
MRPAGPRCRAGGLDPSDLGAEVRRLVVVAVSALTGLGALASGCALAPGAEVAIQSELGPDTRVTRVRWNDCAWEDADLRPGETTALGRCLAGTSPVRFELLDPTFFDEGEPPPVRPFPFRTTLTHPVDAGERRVLVLRPQEVEVDHEDPGRAGH